MASSTLQKKMNVRDKQEHVYKCNEKNCYTSACISLSRVLYFINRLTFFFYWNTHIIIKLRTNGEKKIHTVRINFRRDNLGKRDTFPTKYTDLVCFTIFVCVCELVFLCCINRIIRIHAAHSKHISAAQTNFPRTRIIYILHLNKNIVVISLYKSYIFS